MSPCPLCNSDYDKVIYYGLPAKLCINERCNCLFGLFASFLSLFPFNGYMYAYTGNYFIALFYWFLGIEKE